MIEKLSDMIKQMKENEINHSKTSKEIDTTNLYYGYFKEC